MSWLDLCCGSGRALVQAALQADRHGLDDRVSIVGVDLVDYFDPASTPQALRMICADISSWSPEQNFDLITPRRR